MSNSFQLRSQLLNIDTLIREATNVPLRVIQFEKGPTDQPKELQPPDGATALTTLKELSKISKNYMIFGRDKGDNKIGREILKECLDGIKSAPDPLTKARCASIEGKLQILLNAINDTLKKRIRQPDLLTIEDEYHQIASLYGNHH